MITTPLTVDLVHGAMTLEPAGSGVRPHRLPRLVRERLADQRLTLMEAQPSGVRVTSITMRRARGAADIIVDGALRGSHALTRGDLVELDMATGTSTSTPGKTDHVAVKDLAAGEKTIEIWLPHNERVDLVAPNLHYLDGRSLYGAVHAQEHPLPDGLHPDTATDAQIGERFAALALATNGPLSSP